ncbi:hypothetical protein [Mucilaginibacter gracilis]|uniref:hypothetical protein n=1 Tax=Mucilaginibacter gracilis TaxID=423350 RepID=UPI0013C35C45|nr:hypothetical protein [Mucilaginibacter gracilis]
METVLAYVHAGSSFWFGGVEFIKTGSTYHKLYICTIANTTMTVHITGAACVSTKKV